jgi:hypothetical protein
MFVRLSTQQHFHASDFKVLFLVLINFHVHVHLAEFTIMLDYVCKCLQSLFLLLLVELT